MSAEQLIINFTPATEPVQESVWLHLEQHAVPLSERNATLADMVQMFNRVISGDSARSYQLEKCKVATIKSDGTIVVTLPVYVWPSSMDLPYTFSPSYGSVSLVELVSLEREIDLVVDGSDTVILPWLMDAPMAWWQMDCVNEFCEVVSNPDIVVNGATVSLSASCYGVLRVRGSARGYKHTLIMDFAKRGATVSSQPAETTWLGLSGEVIAWSNPVNSAPVKTMATPAIIGGTVSETSGYSAITNVDVSVTATYSEAEGVPQSQILTIKIPACVGDLLEYCEDGRLAIHGTESVTVGDTEGLNPVVYYDTCTGNVIALRYE